MLCLGKALQHPDSNEAWKKRIEGITTDKSYIDYDGINGEPTEFEWNIFPGFTTLQICGKINDLLSDLGQTPETFTGRILFMSMFNDIQMPESSKYLREDLVLDNGHLLDQVLKRSGILQRRVHEELGIILRKKCCWKSQKVDILLSLQRLHCPEVNSKSKGHGKLSIHFAADELTIETIFRIIISVNQLSVYGAVAAICEEFENHQDGSGEPEI